MADTPQFTGPPLEADQIGVLGQLFALIAVGADTEAELLIAGMTAERKEEFTVSLRAAWESQVWLYGRASELVGNVLLTSPYKEG